MPKQKMKIFHFFVVLNQWINNIHGIAGRQQWFSLDIFAGNSKERRHELMPSSEAGTALGQRLMCWANALLILITQQ